MRQQVIFEQTRKFWSRDQKILKRFIVLLDSIFRQDEEVVSSRI